MKQTDPRPVRKRHRRCVGNRIKSLPVHVGLETGYPPSGVTAPGQPTCNTGNMAGCKQTLTMIFAPELDQRQYGKTEMGK